MFQKINYINKLEMFHIKASNGPFFFFFGYCKRLVHFLTAVLRSQIYFLIKYIGWMFGYPTKINLEHSKKLDIHQKSKKIIFSIHMLLILNIWNLSIFTVMPFEHIRH
jgi:hypothetical protein